MEDAYRTLVDSIELHAALGRADHAGFWSLHQYADVMQCMYRAGLIDIAAVPCFSANQRTYTIP